MENRLADVESKLAEEAELRIAAEIKADQLEAELTEWKTKAKEVDHGTEARPVDADSGHPPGPEDLEPQTPPQEKKNVATSVLKAGCKPAAKRRAQLLSSESSVPSVAPCRKKIVGQLQAAARAAAAFRRSQKVSKISFESVFCLTWPVGYIYICIYVYVYVYVYKYTYIYTHMLHARFT